MGEYKTAVICKNGHTITPYLELHPESDAKYCSKCGEETVKNCSYCKEVIRGIFFSGEYTSWYFSLPKNCHNCGKPYSWTQRKIDAAIEYSEEIENLNPQDIEILKKSIYEISSNSLNSEVSVIRYKKILKKIGGKVGEKLNDFIVDLASETIKKLLKE